MGRGLEKNGEVVSPSFASSLVGCASNFLCKIRKSFAVSKEGWGDGLIRKPSESRAHRNSG